MRCLIAMADSMPRTHVTCVKTKLPLFAMGTLQAKWKGTKTLHHLGFPRDSSTQYW